MQIVRTCSSGYNCAASYRIRHPSEMSITITNARADELYCTPIIKQLLWIIMTLYIQTSKNISHHLLNMICKPRAVTDNFSRNMVTLCIHVYTQLNGRYDTAGPSWLSRKELLFSFPGGVNISWLRTCLLIALVTKCLVQRPISVTIFNNLACDFV